MMCHQRRTGLGAVRYGSVWTAACSTHGMIRRAILPVLCIGSSIFRVSAQDSADRVAEASQTPPVQPEKRLFGIIPNNRTSPSLEHYKPLTATQKYKLASEDAFDRGTFLLAAAFAGQGQLTNSNRSFGQGVEGYAHYFATSYADWAIGDLHDRGDFPQYAASGPALFPEG